jgi:membrane-associated phospholipid phosphatase
MPWDDGTIRDFASQFVQDEVFGSNRWLFLIPWRLLLSVDTMVNALPSMHVAHTCLAAVALGSRNRLWRIIAPMWAAMIIASTLTTKQHYAIDLPGGMALAAICFVLVRFGVEYWRFDRKVRG